MLSSKYQLCKLQQLFGFHHLSDMFPKHLYSVLLLELLELELIQFQLYMELLQLLYLKR